MRELDDIIDSMDMSLNKLWVMVKDREAWRTAVHGVMKSRAWLSDWTTTKQGFKPLLVGQSNNQCGNQTAFPQGFARDSQNHDRIPQRANRVEWVSIINEI